MRLKRLMVPVVAVALGITACGGDDSPSAEEAPAGDEAGDGGAEGETSTEDAEESDEESGDDETESGADGDEVDAVALFTAVADATVEAGSYEFETTTEASGQEMTVAGAIQVGADVSEANMRMTMDVMGAQSTMLLVDGQFYMELTEEMGLPAGQGSWITVGPEGDDPFSQQMGQAFEDIGSAADVPAQLAENPEILTVTEVGNASVDGVDTTEYLVVVNDIEAYAGAEASDAGITELSFSMWIDGDNLPRRVTTEAGGSAAVDTTYSNFGTDVEVEAPPADEVVDMSEMMNQ